MPNFKERASAALDLIVTSAQTGALSNLLFRRVPATNFVTGDNEVERDHRNP